MGVLQIASVISLHFQNGYLLKVFEGHDNLVQSIAFSANGCYLVRVCNHTANLVFNVI